MYTMHRKFHPCCVQPPLHLTLDARITSKLYLPVGNTGADIDTVDSPDPIYIPVRAFKPITLPLLLRWNTWICPRFRIPRACSIRDSSLLLFLLFLIRIGGIKSVEKATS